MLPSDSCSVIVYPSVSVVGILWCLGTARRLPNMSLLILEVPERTGWGVVLLRRSATLIVDDSISVSHRESPIVLDRAL